MGKEGELVFGVLKSCVLLTFSCVLRGTKVAGGKLIMSFLIFCGGQ